MSKHSAPKPARQQNQGSPASDAKPDMQGEGNYTAARRHRAATEHFVDAGKVERAAHEAAPRSPREERELSDAEKSGRSHARK